MPLTVRLHLVNSRSTEIDLAGIEQLENPQYLAKLLKVGSTPCNRRIRIAHAPRVIVEMLASSAAEVLERSLVRIEKLR